MSDWAKGIKESRKAQRRPLSEVAEEVGISVSYLSNLEQGHRPPPAREVVERIALALNRDVLSDLGLAAASRRAVEFEVPEDAHSARARAAAALARAWDDDEMLETVIKTIEGKEISK